MNGPIAEAMGVYDREACARPFEEDLRLHLLYGYVVATPDYFIMARPVKKGADREDILNPAHIFPDPDCWHIWCMAGDIRKCWEHDPFPDMPWVSWERANVLRYYPMEVVRRKVCR